MAAMSNSTPVPTPRPRWEYLAIEEKPKRAAEVLNAAGQQGWEAFSVVAQSPSRTVTFLLKRLQ
jgi:hypothetical protein